ncbi:uncharacterized protein LOC115301534 isoform X2 [Suricata suricatta]|uniref:uncharacterized protein LOC115301534 isoform X2 n=1 Tax=Suricata suricatta TaxID=37032 RepID=UPI0011557C71|nr:uncharacterized protein LOC115301534 isoform X2 [Suricata suricatta]
MTTSIYALVSEICGLLKSTNKHIFKGRENFSGSDQLPPFILLFGRESKTPSDSEAARGRLWGQSSARLESSGMDLVRGKVRWSRTEPRRGREAADGEQGRILLTEAQAPRRQQPKGHSSKPRRKIPGFLRRLRRNKEPQNVCEMETSKDFQHLVQKGQFLEAYESLSVLAQEGQDCGPQFEALAQGMWRVVQQALQGAGHSQELEAVLDTVEATTLLDDGNAAWGGQLGRLLRMDAEARVPTLKPGDQLGPFLEKLDKAVRQGLGSPRASQLGTRLWETYRTCFQEVLCSRLWGLTTGPCGADLKSCLQLYTWGKTACFLRPGETLLNAPPAAQEPTAGHLLDPIMMFVTWMSQTQEKLVGMIQEKVEAALEKVLICDRKQWAQFSRPKTFLEISQLLEANTKAVQHLGPSITSQVQAVVLKTFSTFLNRYKVEAVGFLQRNATAGAFPEVHVLENCCILRETWQNLSQAHVPPEDLGPAVQGAIHFIEDHSRDHLVPRVRALCQSQLRAHFGSKDKDLVHALQSLWQGLEGCPRLHSSPLYEVGGGFGGDWLAGGHPEKLKQVPLKLGGWGFDIPGGGDRPPTDPCWRSLSSSRPPPVPKGAPLRPVRPCPGTAFTRASLSCLFWGSRALCEVCTWWSLGSTSRPWPLTSGRWSPGSGTASGFRWRWTSRSWMTSSGGMGGPAWPAQRSPSWRSSSSVRTRAGRLWRTGWPPSGTSSRVI